MQEILIEYKQELLKHENVNLEDFILDIASNGLLFWNEESDDTLRVWIFEPNEQN